LAPLGNPGHEFQAARGKAETGVKRCQLILDPVATENFLRKRVADRCQPYPLKLHEYHFPGREIKSLILDFRIIGSPTGGKCVAQIHTQTPFEQGTDAKQKVLAEKVLALHVVGQNFSGPK
jgi:hypothetical protein